MSYGLNLFKSKSLKKARVTTFEARSARFKARPRLVRARILQKLRNGDKQLKQVVSKEFRPAMYKLDDLIRGECFGLGKPSLERRKKAAKEARVILNELTKKVDAQIEYLSKLEKLGQSIIEPFNPTMMGVYKETQLERNYHERHKSLWGVKYQLEEYIQMLKFEGL
ncbi:MAG: hypothetical protein WC821_00760 [archaeon]|jgi:hypothetical protein